jgi:hypothetical protein
LNQWKSGNQRQDDGDGAEDPELFPAPPGQCAGFSVAGGSV